MKNKQANVLKVISLTKYLQRCYRETLCSDAMFLDENQIKESKLKILSRQAQEPKPFGHSMLSRFIENQKSKFLKQEEKLRHSAKSKCNMPLIPL